MSGKEGLWWYKTLLLYRSRATLTSSIYQDSYQRMWQQVQVIFSNCNPGGTEVHVYVRVSRNGTTWTGWIGPYVFSGSGSMNLYQPSIPGSDTFIENNFRYLQYRVELYSNSDSTLSPILDEIRFIYDPLGGDDELDVSERSGKHLTLRVYKGELEVKAYGKEIRVISVDGKVILTKFGELKSRLPRGIYYILINNKLFKKVVI